MSKIIFNYLFCSPNQNLPQPTPSIIAGWSPPNSGVVPGQCVGQTGKAKIYTPKALNLGFERERIYFKSRQYSYFQSWFGIFVQLVEQHDQY